MYYKYYFGWEHPVLFTAVLCCDQRLNQLFLMGIESGPLARFAGRADTDNYAGITYTKHKEVQNRRFVSWSKYILRSALLRDNRSGA